MKVLGTTSGGYLIEATEQEIALVAGYTGTYDSLWKKFLDTTYPRYGSHNGIPSGTIIDVKAITDWHHALKSSIEKVEGSANMLRALADMMTGAIPEVIRSPIKATLKTSEES